MRRRRQGLLFGMHVFDISDISGVATRYHTADLHCLYFVWVHLWLGHVLVQYGRASARAGLFSFVCQSPGRPALRPGWNVS